MDQSFPDTAHIEDILEQEQLILTDNSFIAGGNTMNSPWYYEDMYHVKKFLDLSINSLNNALELYEGTMLWLQNPHVYTTSGVIDEMKTFRDILNGKLSWLRTYDARGSPSHNKPPQDNDADLETDEKRELLEDVCKLYHQTVKLADKKEFKAQYQTEYGAVENIVAEITRHTGAKIDFEFRYKKYPKKYEDTHADEQLVAAAIYSSIIDNVSSAIVTADSDIERIFSNTWSYFKNSNAQGFENVLRLVEKNPIHIYFLLDIPEIGVKTDIRTGLKNNISLDIPTQADAYIKKEFSDYLFKHVQNM